MDSKSIQPIIDFRIFVKTEIQGIRLNYDKARESSNKKLKTEFEKKYPFLKTKHGYPSFDEILCWDRTHAKFSEEYLNELIRAYISKINGIYKHGQTEKTGLCNLRILSNVRMGKLTIAIAKNTLSAKEQWESRLLKSLREEYPHTPLKDLILIISSKRNDLDGNATHCANMKLAISEFMLGNFKILFLCSNVTRICDILTFLNHYDKFSLEMRIPIEVQHDEAHNAKDGIPSKRELIENIIMSEYVTTYVPVSASPDPIYKEDSAFWKRENVEAFAIDYTNISDTISTDRNYSSISKAQQLSFEDLEQHPSYRDYNITEYDEAIFREADQPGFYTSWDNPDEVQADIDRRRKLEFCAFMALEKDAINYGMNILDNYMVYSYVDSDGSEIETQLFLEGVTNLHLITTPCRVAMTITLMKYAIRQSYNPICIGLYRGEIHIRYRNSLRQLIKKTYGEFSDKSSGTQLNDKILEILTYLKRKGESIDRPILIMGNYIPTGESITFVHYDYGIIRSVTLLPSSSQTRESNYQGFLRCCYMDTKFREKNQDFKHPVKWMIGSQKSINDAITYEQENDQRITRLKSESGIEKIPLIHIQKTDASEMDDGSHISTPVMICITDLTNEHAVEFISLLNKPKRYAEDRKQILIILKNMIATSVVIIRDPTGKFHPDTYTLSVVSTYRKKSLEEIEARKIEKGDQYKSFESEYRFREYHSKHETNQHYINRNATIQKGCCELLVALDRYEYEGYINQKTVMWLSYRY